MNGDSFLDEYGQTADEITWITDSSMCFQMPKSDAERRIETVKKFFPDATIEQL